MKSWSWVLLILLVIAIKWAALYPQFVERYYTYGLYPVISRIQRLLLGWIPFSVGDLFYGFVLLLLAFRIGRFFRLLFRRELNRNYFRMALQQSIFLVLFIYVFFYGLWGLNYNREGIEKQLGLKVQRYSLADLDTLATVLQGELNRYAAGVTEQSRDDFDKKSRLFREARNAYTAASVSHPFLQYGGASVKPSIFSYAGNYLGFQGYYNPFSGEAQVNTTTPRFLEPFVTTHEIAHQLGYAKENEANFVGFLACLHSPSPVVLYSMYFDMYNYAAGEIYQRDSTRAKMYSEKLHPQVKKDIITLRTFIRRHRNPVEAFIMWGYGNYLKANNQPGGKQTYNEVVGWLVAYYKKFGTDALKAAVAADIR
ncbi:MAG: DUF3810 domain-containing protein [Chitinophagaceae bacterium]|nr:MAG: DUF3810 domain-containing protein [Chitinophagaceae bacterium]